jgi:hypothetical protein
MLTPDWSTVSEPLQTIFVLKRIEQTTRTVGVRATPASARRSSASCRDLLTGHDAALVGLRKLPPVDPNHSAAHPITTSHALRKPVLTPVLNHDGLSKRVGTTKLIA